MVTADRPIRRPGSPWRLLAHEYVGLQPSGISYETEHHVTNDPAAQGRREAAVARLKMPPELMRTHTLPPNCEFDELVVGSWLHVEQMDEQLWWLDIGGLTVHVEADADGKPLRVWWDTEAMRDGVEYEDRT